MADASLFFWNRVTGKRSVSIGGNSVREHFNPPDDYSSMMEHPEGPETCNTYNMMRLSEMLFLQHQEASYIDYYERALYNHILSSQHPEKGGYVYFTPMRPNHYRVDSQPHENFWCCVGSGLENHGKYGKMIYSHRGEDLYINLFIPSNLTWNEQGIRVIQKTGFPFEEYSKVEIDTEKPKKFAINIRFPEWTGTGNFNITVNGEPWHIENEPSSYISVRRTWRSGDSIVISLPMQTRVEYLPDGSPWASILHGPLVLAAATTRQDMDGLFARAERMHRDQAALGRLYPVDENPRLIRDELDKIDSLIIPERDKSLSFRLPKEMVLPAEKADELVLVPFFRIHETRYMLYWPVVGD
jgi:uncharacterized protein